jgi:hypothetical protein
MNENATEIITAKIETNPKTGNKCLMVPYESDNFNQAIDAALAYHGIKTGEMVLIAFPKRIPGGGDRIQYAKLI